MPCIFKMKSVVVCLSILLLANLVHGVLPDYYWRDYRGTIPEDALVAHENAEGKIYIGQGYINGIGLLNGRIYPGNKEITLTGRDAEVYTKSNFVKILCTQHPKNFRWIPTNENSVYEIPYHLVEGGLEDNNGVLYIARLVQNDEIRIGNAIGYEFVTAKMRYVENKERKTIDDYDVLVYTDHIPRSEDYYKF